MQIIILHMQSIERHFCCYLLRERTHQHNHACGLHVTTTVDDSASRETQRRRKRGEVSWREREREEVLTEEGGGVDGSGRLGVDLGEPGRNDAGPSDDAEVARLAQHGDEERREDPEARPRPDHVRHPSPAVRSPERSRER